jgi:hypothetical protein
MSSNAKVPQLTPEEEEKYKSVKVCENFSKEFGNKVDGEKVIKVRHHDHVTNKFIGAWCSRYKFKNNNRYFKTIVVFHNFSGYDGHFIIKYAARFMHDEEPYSYNSQKIISKSSKKNKHFQYSDSIFIDSMNHLSTSLDKLVDVLNKSGYSFPIFTNVGLHKILRSKGIYPYRWINTTETFNERSLPSIEWFDNDLTGEKCSQERYNKALEVWNELKCVTFKDYHMAYFESDVVLLVEVFENYRESCMKMFGLDRLGLSLFNQ